MSDKVNRSLQNDAGGSLAAQSNFTGSKLNPIGPSRGNEAIYLRDSPLPKDASSVLGLELECTCVCVSQPGQSNAGAKHSEKTAKKVFTG